MNTTRTSAVSDQAGLAVPLNRSEHSYTAVGSMACTINQVYMLRFDTPIAEAEMRRVLRRLISLQPRLRGVIEPTWRTWRLRVLPDDDVVDQLFDIAFRVVRGIDTEDRDAVEAYANELLNEPLAMERGLGLRFGFMPHAQRPVLVLCIEHTLGDGRSMMMWVNTIVRLLNGEDVPPEGKVDAPSMIRAIVPRRLIDWPRSLWSAWRFSQDLKRRRAGRTLCTLDTKTLPRITAHGVRWFEMTQPVAAIKAAAKKSGASMNTFLLTAVTQTVLARRREDPAALAAVRISVDLRPYFGKGREPGMGNYVASFYVLEGHGQPMDQVRSIDAQMKDNLGRFERHEMLFPWLPAEVMPALGRRLYTLIAMKLRAADKISAMSCHFTTVGDIGWINPKDARIRMCEFFPVVTCTGPLFATISFNGRQLAMLGYQLDRMPREEADRFLREVDAMLTAMVEDAGVLQPAAAPGATETKAQPSVAASEPRAAAAATPSAAPAVV